MNNDDLITEFFGDRECMRTEEDPSGTTHRLLPEDFLELLSARGIKTNHWLIDQEEAWLVEKESGHREALAHPVAEAPDPLLLSLGE